MTLTFMRHFIAAIGTLITLTIFLGGYFSGRNGWWWCGLGVVIVYIIIYKVINE